VGLAGPTEQELREAYARADAFGRDVSSRVFKLNLDPQWFASGKAFWYRNELPGGRREFWQVDALGKKATAFDHSRLAEVLSTQLSRPISGQSLPFRDIEFLDTSTIRFDIEGQGWKLDLGAYELSRVAPKSPIPARPQQPWRQDLYPVSTRMQTSPDKNLSAVIQDGSLRIRKGDAETRISREGAGSSYLSRFVWSPDSKHLITFWVTPGDRKQVYLLESSPALWGPAQLQSRVYDRPGDKVDAVEIRLVAADKGTEYPIEAEILDYDGIPEVKWNRDASRFTYAKMDRGYGRWRVIEVDPSTGKTKTLIDEDPTTFVDSTNLFVEYVDGSDEIIWRSERDGWGHLFITDRKETTKQITKGKWVVRGVDRVDAKARQIIFRASGMNPKEDPYYVHYYRVGFDGRNLTCLTPELGNHSAKFSPDWQLMVDSYSTPTTAPAHVLRRATDGKYLTLLEKGDATALAAIGWKPPQPFVAKARDGVTDIYGLVFRPSNFDPSKKYPIIEDIYAGPHDSFVPKSFSPSSYLQALAELGFVVVKIDGMGTRNRSKAFHDVCYKNIADAGFPDRILWLKTLASTDSALDLSRVGIFGTSAGGQSSTGALLFHPDFYKVAVSSCGCHDNRLDKIWWNEQWMGYPVGPEYVEQSNITNAAKLQGKLLLMVGELDDNVPPESTYRLVDALIKAKRDFEFVLLPGQRHTGGGAFGERKRRDFFVKHLMGVDPPAWNSPAGG
jgi:dipeptidyl aminopeptidase/acylaminoacyl peptidase